MINHISKNQIHDLKKLQQKKHRKLEGVTLVEGWNLFEQLVANGKTPEQIITTQADNIKQKYHNLTCPIYSATEQELKALAETDTPQSIVAVFCIPEFSIPAYRAILYLDGIRDPGNVGTIFRIATAFGFNGIALSPDCCEVFSPKVIRASLGSVFWVPSFTAGESWLKEQNADIIGLIGNSKTSFSELKTNTTRGVVLVIGSEGSGISSSVKATLTHEVRIPISNEMESLNAAVAAGIGAYEISHRLFLLT